MFVHQKRNKSGIISVQIIDKSSGKYCLYQTVGSALEAKEISLLVKKGNDIIKKISGQQSLNFDSLVQELTISIKANRP